MDGRTREAEPGQVVLRPTGELDMATADTFEAALLDAVHRPGLREVVIDLTDVSFLDSSGVRVLVRGAGTARERGATLRVIDPRPIVERVLRVTAVGPLLGLAAADPPTGRGFRGLA